MSPSKCLSQRAYTPQFPPDVPHALDPASAPSRNAITLRSRRRSPRWRHLALRPGPIQVSVRVDQSGDDRRVAEVVVGRAGTQRLDGRNIPSVTVRRPRSSGSPSRKTPAGRHGQGLGIGDPREPLPFLSVLFSRCGRSRKVAPPPRIRGVNAGSIPARRLTDRSGG